MKLFDEGVADVTLKLLHLSSHKAQFKALGTLRIMANKQSEDHVHTCTYNTAHMVHGRKKLPSMGIRTPVGKPVCTCTCARACSCMYSSYIYALTENHISALRCRPQERLQLYFLRSIVQKCKSFFSGVVASAAVFPSGIGYSSVLRLPEAEDCT